MLNVLLRKEVVRSVIDDYANAVAELARCTVEFPAGVAFAEQAVAHTRAVVEARLDLIAHHLSRGV
jgi:hypothetical protein